MKQFYQIILVICCLGLTNLTYASTSNYVDYDKSTYMDDDDGDGGGGSTSYCSLTSAGSIGGAQTGYAPFNPSPIWNNRLASGGNSNGGGDDDDGNSNGDDDGYSRGNSQNRAEVLTLDAFAQISSVDLTWINNTSYKNTYFEVERSADGVDFEKIDELSDVGTGDRENHLYRNTDRSPLDGDNYYRVKALHKDGTHRYTEVQKVNFTSPDQFTLFPNPATTQVTVEVGQYMGKDIEISIVNQVGKRLVYQEIDGLNQRFIDIQLDGILNGQYIVYIESKGKQRIAKKLIVMKTY